MQDRVGGEGDGDAGVGMGVNSGAGVGGHPRVGALHSGGGMTDRPTGAGPAR